MQIKVLSRSVDTERRDSINRQFKNLSDKYSYSFFEAITPKTLPNIIAKKSNFLTDGEKCCAFSHLMMYKELISSNDKYQIFMEDDAKLNVSDYNDELIGALDYFHDKFDVIILGYSKVNDEIKRKIQFFRPLFHVAQFNNIKIGIPYKQWKCGTVCYSISRSGAQKIVKENSDCIYTADDWSHFKQKGLKVAHLTPIIVTELFDDFVSSLEAERKTFKPKGLIVRYIAGFMRHFLCFVQLIRYVSKR